MNKPFAPFWRALRSAFPYSIKLSFGGRRAYRGADQGAREGDWPATISSADAALLPEASVLVARARDIVRNNPIGKSIIRAFRRNVIGHGITPSPAREVNGTPDRNWNELALALWDEWADSRECERERKRTFYAVQRWVASELVLVGEAFVVLMEEEVPEGGGTRLVLQLFESEQLDTERTSYTQGDVTRQVRKGVEVDEFGAAVAYHLARVSQPDYLGISFKRDIQRVEASRVLHIFDPDRARQSRGEPRMACCLPDLWHLAQYEQSQLLGARAEASIGFGIESEQTLEDASGATVDKDGNKAKRDPVFKMGPLSIFRAKPGEKLVTFMPTRPGNQYMPFVMMKVRRIAAAVGLCYEVVMRDFSTTNFSGLRTGLQEDRREYGEMQELIIAQLCEPVWRAKMANDVLNGRLRPPVAEWKRSRRAFELCHWMPQGWAWIDPEAEASAYETGLRTNTTTLREILSGRGRNWRQVLSERAEERAEEKRLGIVPAEPPPPSNATKRLPHERGSAPPPSTDPNGANEP